MAWRFTDDLFQGSCALTITYLIHMIGDNLALRFGDVNIVFPYTRAAYKDRLTLRLN